MHAAISLLFNVYRFPVSEYPVIALMGAPGAFPVHKQDRWLQKFVQWSEKVEKKAKEFIDRVLNNEPFVGIHLRNGIDFVSAAVVHGASPQPFNTKMSSKLYINLCIQ